jgi:hypothetical protein
MARIKDRFGNIIDPNKSNKQRKSKKNALSTISRSVDVSRPLPRAQLFTTDLYPDRYRVRLKMTDLYRAAFNGTTGVLCFRARSNSVNSPGIDYNWHQPFFYDQLVSVYDKCVVYRTTGKFIFAMDSGASSIPLPPSIRCLVTNQGLAAGTPNNYTSFYEQFYDVERSRGVHGHTTPTKSCALTYTTSASQEWGKERSEYDDEAFSEQTSTTIGASSPNFQLPWLISATCADTASTVNVSVSIDMEYECEFYSKKAIAHS